MKFEKGTSGNPNGRPRKSHREQRDDIRTMLYGYLQDHFDEVFAGMNSLDDKEKIRIFCSLLKYTETKQEELPDHLKLLWP